MSVNRRGLDPQQGELPSPFGVQLRRAINESSLSQNRLCRRAGLQAGAIDRFMTGRGGLSMKTIEGLVACLDLELCDIRTFHCKRRRA